VAARATAVAPVSVAGEQLLFRTGRLRPVRDFPTRMTMRTETAVELPFKLESITKAAAPDGAEGVWHSYVISQGTNTIAGVRAGTHAEVTLLVNDMVERLNARREGKFRAKSKG
jgi:hypothetical protein